MMTAKSFTSNPFLEDFKMELNVYIVTHHNSNVSEFARAYSVKPNQAQRWIDRGCKVENDQVWCPITKHKKVEL